jgi:hypothetical protein
MVSRPSNEPVVGHAQHLAVYLCDRASGDGRLSSLTVIGGDAGGKLASNRNFLSAEGMAKRKAAA